MSAPTILYLTRDDVAGLGISMAEVVATVDAAFREKGAGRAVAPPKLSLQGEAGAFSQAMAAALPALGGLGVKWLTIVPANAAAGRPTVNGLMVVNDPVDGLPEAVIDASLITAWRTGASVAVAARYLARPDAAAVGVVGCGVQGRAAVDALAVVLPGLRVVRCYDIVAQAAARFASDVRSTHPGLAVQVCAAPDEAARGADVVVSAVTMGDAEPFLGPDTLTDGALAVALDYDAAWSPAAMAACDRFYCDDTAQVLATKAHGPRLQHIPQTVAGDLGGLAVGAAEGRRDETERLFCMNLGIAIEDVATAQLVLARARERGVGLRLPR
ncbi:MAG TPA: hypothetical protein PK838_08360 [Thermoleophilia bacterium]|nr:hypothetical protein [Thermoleophilia bacterium]